MLICSVSSYFFRCNTISELHLGVPLVRTCYNYTFCTLPGIYIHVDRKCYIYIYSKLSEVLLIIVSLFSLYSEAPKVHRVERSTCFGGEGGDLPKVNTQAQQDRRV